MTRNKRKLLILPGEKAFSPNEPGSLVNYLRQLWLPEAGHFQITLVAHGVVAACGAIRFLRCSDRVIVVPTDRLGEGPWTDAQPF